MLSVHGFPLFLSSFSAFFRGLKEIGKLSCHCYYLLWISHPCSSSYSLFIVSYFLRSWAFITGCCSFFLEIYSWQSFKDWGKGMLLQRAFSFASAGHLGAQPMNVLMAWRPLDSTRVGQFRLQPLQLWLFRDLFLTAMLGAEEIFLQWFCLWLILTDIVAFGVLYFVESYFSLSALGRS